jgi:hypothetical protein
MPRPLTLYYATKPILARRAFAIFTKLADFRDRIKFSPDAVSRGYSCLARSIYWINSVVFRVIASGVA